MLETFKNFGGKKLGGLILIIVIIIAFGFGGFGGGFSTNNQNNIAKINKRMLLLKILWIMLIKVEFHKMLLEII